MWYASGTGWTFVEDRPEPLYHIKYAESRDGVRWERTGQVCVDYDHFARAIGRPCVYRDEKLYKMLYSYRGLQGYRTNANISYRLGYAESEDGITWVRKDDEVGIGRSEDGWDSQMIEYCYVLKHSGRTYLFYNGNGFGQSGIGYATLDGD